MELSEYAKYDGLGLLPIWEKLTATELFQALDIYTFESRSVGAFFGNYDVLLSPTTAHPPLPLGELNQNASGLSAEQWTTQIFTYAPFTNLFFYHPSLIN